MSRDERLEDVRENPQRHKHYDLNSLLVCSMVDGAIDTAIMRAHEGLLGYNGGVPCDVQNGPCSCGAWH